MAPEEVSGVRGSVLSRETTFTPTDPNTFEYPFPDEQNAQLYQRYRKRAADVEDLLICGRLGEYRYYDMDQAIGRALMLAQRILQGTDSTTLGSSGPTR